MTDTNEAAIRVHDPIDEAIREIEKVRDSVRLLRDEAKDDYGRGFMNAWGNGLHNAVRILAALRAPAEEAVAAVGPTGQPKCPVCGNSLDNTAPNGSPNLRRCASCKRLFAVSPAILLRAPAEPLPIDPREKIVRNIAEALAERWPFDSRIVGFSLTEAMKIIEQWLPLSYAERPQEPPVFLGAYSTERIKKLLWQVINSPEKEGGGNYAALLEALKEEFQIGIYTKEPPAADVGLESRLAAAEAEVARLKEEDELINRNYIAVREENTKLLTENDRLAARVEELQRQLRDSDRQLDLATREMIEAKQLNERTAP